MDPLPDPPGLGQSAYQGGRAHRYGKGGADDSEASWGRSAGALAMLKQSHTRADRPRSFGPPLWANASKKTTALAPSAKQRHQEDKAMNRTTSCVLPSQIELTPVSMSCALLVASLARPRGALALVPARALGALALRRGGGSALAKLILT